MSKSLKKEINELVDFFKKEVVDHTVANVHPVSTGFPTHPVSLVSRDVFMTYLNNARRHLEKSLEEITIVIDQLDSRNQSAGDLILIRDQISAAVQKFDQQLQL